MGEKICHYTKDRCVDSIMSNFNLRAILSTQSNDDKDTVLLKDLLIESSGKIIEEILKTEKGDFYTVENLKNMLTGLFYKFNDDRISDFSSNGKSRKCFVVCFTDKKDSRFLWNSYSENTGINFTFDSAKLRSCLESQKMLQNTYEYFKLDKINYDPDKQYREVRRIVKKNYNLYMKKGDNSLSNITIPFSYRLNFTDENGKTLYQGNRNDLIITLKKNFVDFAIYTINEFLDIAPFFKHIYWSEESEYRLVLYRRFQHEILTNVEVDDKDRYYINVSFDKELLEEIRIGPLSKYSKEEISKKYLSKYKNCHANDSKGRGILRY